MSGNGEPLRMLHQYRVRPAALNPRARASLPDYVSEIGGMVDAYSPAQAFAKLIGRLLLPDSMQPLRILDELEACASNEESDFYSPGFLEDLGEEYPLKRNIAAWLANHYVEEELGSFRLPAAERRKRAAEFLAKHGVHDSRSGTITLPAAPTKSYLRNELRRTLRCKSKAELKDLYNEEAMEQSAETAWPAVAEEPDVPRRRAIVQLSFV
jgi:hypothetical protein